MPAPGSTDGRDRLEACGGIGEEADTGQAVHDLQLRDVQCVVVTAGQHFPGAVAGLVERPPSGIELVEPRLERADACGPQLQRLGRAAPLRVVVDAPQRPDEAVEDVAWRIDQVFLNPDVAARPSPARHHQRQDAGATESRVRRVRVGGLARRLRGANEQ